MTIVAMVSFALASSAAWDRGPVLIEHPHQAKAAGVAKPGTVAPEEKGAAAPSSRWEAFCWEYGRVEAMSWLK